MIQSWAMGHYNKHLPSINHIFSFLMNKCIPIAIGNELLPSSFDHKDEVDLAQR